MSKKSLIQKRYLYELIKEDLKKKMVFIGGPRQVGKTTLSQQFLKNYHDKHPAYLNWDSDLHRKKIRERNWPSDAKIIIFDEIHKLKGWRNFLKGIFDTLKNTHSFLVTGSARLDHFRKGGDSLLGRYFYYRLHPLSLGEVGVSKENALKLFKFGGFPEPFYSEDIRFLRRWHISRVSKLVRTDLRDLENIQDLDKMELLAEALPEKVGSPLSFNSLAEDLQIDPKTSKRWVSVLESLYYCFLISPYGSSKIRAVKKEQKLYLWDWSQVEDEGARFENLVASQLLKYCHFLEDSEGHKMELRYIRDRDKREVDFVILKNKQPQFAVECKLRSKGLSPHLFYFQERLEVPVYYQVHLEGNSRSHSDSIKEMSFVDFCKMLKMP